MLRPIDTGTDAVPAPHTSSCCFVSHLKKSPTSRKAESAFRKDSFLWSKDYLRYLRDYKKWNFFTSTSRRCGLAAALDKKLHLKIIFQTVLPKIKDLHLPELQIFPLLHFFCLGGLTEACGTCYCWSWFVSRDSFPTQNSMYFLNLGAFMVSTAPATCGNSTLISKLNVNRIFHRGGMVAHHCHALKTWVLLPKSQPQVNHRDFLVLCASRSAQGGR